LPKPDRKKHCTGNDHHNHDYPADDHNSPTNYNNDDDHDHDSPTDNNNDHDCSTDYDYHDYNDDDSSTDYDYHDYNDDDSSTDYDYDICSRNYNSECTIWGVGNSWKLTGFAYLDGTNFEWWIVDYRLRDRI
jgi:hypothetical protein